MKLGGQPFREQPRFGSYLELINFIKIFFMYRFVLLLAVALFGFSLFLPVYAEKPDLLGYFAFLGGWMVGVNDIPTAISWFANVMFIISLWMILKRKNPKPYAAMVFGVLAIVFGLAILGAGKAFVGASETVGKLALGNAFYAWIGSFVLITLAAWLKRKHLASKAEPVNAQNQPA